MKKGFLQGLKDGIYDADTPENKGRPMQSRIVSEDSHGNVTVVGPEIDYGKLPGGQEMTEVTMVPGATPEQETHKEVGASEMLCYDFAYSLVNSELNRQLNPTTCLGDADCWIQQVTAPTLVVTCWIQQSTCILPSTCTGGRSRRRYQIRIFNLHK